MYVEKTDTYTCDFCGHNAKWDASDDVHGELWSCENGTQTETVLYDDWNGTAAYNSTFNPNFKKGE